MIFQRLLCILLDLFNAKLHPHSSSAQLRGGQRGGEGLPCLFLKIEKIALILGKIALIVSIFRLIFSIQNVVLRLHETSLVMKNSWLRTCGFNSQIQRTGNAYLVCMKAYLGPCQTSVIELLAKTGNG